MSDARPKLTRGLLKTLCQTQTEEQPLSIIVQYSDNRRIMRHSTEVFGLRRGHAFHLRPFAQMQATPTAIYRLENEPDVVRIYQDLPVHAYLDVSVPHIQVPLVWGEGFVGEGVRLAVVDTGIDPNHPDLCDRIRATADMTREGTDDGNGHGTHCAGIAAGSGQASGGRYRGVAPGAELYIAKVLDTGGNGMMSDVMAGVEWAVDQGVQIISLSLGTPGPTDGNDALSQMCDAAVEAGVVVCAAAGNDGPGAYTLGAPGGARRAITVGASSDLDRIAGFSSRGPTRDGRVKPDVVLPGVEIVAARAHGTTMGSPIDTFYTSASGTSMATPHAAGICALLLEAEPDLPPDEIKRRLMDAAIDLGSDPYAQGRGRVDAWKVLQNLPGSEPPAEQPPLPEPPPVAAPGCLTALLRLVHPRSEH